MQIRLINGQDVIIFVLLYYIKYVYILIQLF